MTTLILQTAGSVVGGFLAGPVGGVVGRVLGAVAGAGLDAALFAGRPRGRFVEGPRLKDVNGLGSTEGAPIPRIYGRARLGGELIWATRLLEVATTDVTRTPADGGGGKGSSPRTETTVATTYTYFANLAVGLCQGPIAFVRRVWADGRELDLTTVAMRVHLGTEDQPADPLIVAKEGAENAPAYRGLAYVVFERLALQEFGNRVPQFSFEVVRPVGGLGRLIRAVCLIPGSTEFGYAVSPVAQDLGLGRTQPENVHQFQRTSDVLASLDALQALCPNLERVSLVVSWFGDDLRAGACTIAPRIDRRAKTTSGGTWTCAGLDRSTARTVSLGPEGGPAYGGTPSDASVVALIGELKKRSLEVVLYPFVMMDIPAGNALPNPLDGAASQPPFPWRGRITCDPAPGRPGTADGTGAAATQVAAFFGGGADDWSFRRLVHHYAALASSAGGVDGFVIGSELVGLTRVRSAPGVYPAVEEMAQLAGEVRAMLGPGTRLVYAADWTEYGAHVLEGGAEVRFPLDPLWAHPAIDAVGIDFYPPITDWRDGPGHLDAAEARSSADPDYLRRRLDSGEAFDWFYASEADRRAQQRTPITDGAYGKPWTFRAKDLGGWWSNPHVERVGGIETSATAWVPSGKPIWLTEIGIPAVDKGPNGPNVFPDPKSSENAVPPFSRGARDDLVQARGLEAILARFGEGAAPAMVDPGHVFVWAWDARPFPAFPDFDLVWADGRNYDTGHWITGRLEGLPLDRLIAAILSDFGLDPADRIEADGFVDGYVVDRPMSARGALESLAELFGVEAAVSGGALAFIGRGRREAIQLAPGDLVAPERGEPTLCLTRAQETELPGAVHVGFTDAEGDYRRAAVSARRLAGASRREAGLDTAIVTSRAEAGRLADGLLQDAWAGRETAEFALSPRRIGLEAGDLVSIPAGGAANLHQIVRIADGPTRRISTRAVDPASRSASAAPAARSSRRPPALPGPPFAALLDLPAARGDPPGLQYIAVAAEPWPGAVGVWRSGPGGTAELRRVVDRPALVGQTLTDLGPGPIWRWDIRGALDVAFSADGLNSVDDAAALAGRNTLAARGPDGAWEILTAARAEMIGRRTYRLSRLLRGLAGSEDQASRMLSAGALVVVLDDAVVPLTGAIADIGTGFTYRVGPASRGPADPSAVELVGTVTSLALKPFAPVGITARRDAAGVTLGWIRRTRRGGDPWEAVEAPLGEESELYEVDVFSGSTRVRTLASTGPTLLYPAATEAADFGGPQAALTLAVAQVSSVVGRGFARPVSVPVL